MNIISVHIPKTSGTYFKNILNKLDTNILFFDYGIGNPNTRLILDGVDQYIDDENSLKTFLKCFIDRGKTFIIHGHFPASKYDFICSDRILITWVRHPIKRLYSLYNYWLKINPFKKSHEFLYFKKNINSFSEFAINELYTNYISRYFDCKSLNEFDFIGVQDEISLSMELFKNKFKQNFIYDINNYINKGNYNTDIDQINLSEEIFKANKDDFDLYLESLDNLFLNANLFSFT